MAYTLSKEKANAIATEYCYNGYKKVLALLSVGYKESYAKTLGLKLYDNIKVCDAIAVVEANKETKQVYSRLMGEQEYEEARDIAKNKHDASSMIAATTGKCKLYGLHIDTSLNIDANLGRRPLDAQEAIEHSRKMVASVPIKNPDDP